VLEASRRRIAGELPPDALVLDVGGWASPLPRADWVLDLMPYETRGLYGTEGAAGEPERFGPGTWVRRDVCDREPWPFADDAFAFAVCSHTLEDVRDPVWVCAELARVARAGYLEVPSRAEEQSFGLQGPWTGWGHHHWLCETFPDADPPAIEFVFKHHILHGREDLRRPAGGLDDEQRVAVLWWEGTFAARERIFVGPGELDAYLAEVAEPPPPRGRGRRGRR